MATRQYIGARYVPIVFGEWVQNRAYEPLTVVTYLGGSYTSKKSVPSTVGNPADNSNYWAATGMYSAQVAELQDAVNELSDDLVDLEAVVASPARHIIVIMDSYGTINGGGSTLTRTVGAAVTSMLGWPASYIHYSARNSAGFCNDYFQDQIEAIDTGGHDADVRDVYVLGGWNDRLGVTGHDEATIRSKAQTFLNYCNAHFPAAAVHILGDGYGYNETDTVINGLWSALLIYDRLSDKGFVTHPNFKFVMHKPSYFLPDSGHPNDSGVTALGSALKDVILTGDNTVQYNKDVTSFTVPGATIATNGSMRLVERLYNGLTSITNFTVRAFYTFEEAQSWPTSTGSAIKICDLPSDSDISTRGYNYNSGGQVSFPVYDSSYNETIVTGLIVVNNNALYFMPDRRKNTSGADVTLSVKYFTFPSFNIAAQSR